MNLNTWPFSKNSLSTNEKNIPGRLARVPYLPMKKMDRLKIVIFLLKMVMFTLKMAKFMLKMFIFLLKMVMFLLKMVIFLLKTVSLRGKRYPPTTPTFFLEDFLIRPQLPRSNNHPLLQFSVPLLARDGRCFLVYS